MNSKILGKVVLEEVFDLPEDLDGWKRSWGVKVFPNNLEERASWITDITKIRTDFARQSGVGHQILSHTNPGVQGVTDADEAAKYASHVNDYLVHAIKGYEHCLGAFAALPMHNGQQAPRSFGATWRHTVLKVPLLDLKDDIPYTLAGLTLTRCGEPAKNSMCHSTCTPHHHLQSSTRNSGKAASSLSVR